MRLSNSNGLFLGIVLATICLISCYSSEPSSIDSSSYSKYKRSPFLRLDELSTKIYLTKNKLGGGRVDPLQIGKRSIHEVDKTSEEDPEIELALMLYAGLSECLIKERCSRALKILLDG